MDHIFQTLTDFSLDPFRQLAAADDPHGALCSAGLDPKEARELLNPVPVGTELIWSSFDSCDTCVDPGDDPDPFG